MSFSTRPIFIDQHPDSRFALYFCPDGAPRGQILFVPPFCEEMNRCRNMLAHQARVMAERGYACLVLDLFGTGDSCGELKDATWDLWLNDIQRGLDWLNSSTILDLPVYLFGIRLGALLVLDFACRNQVSLNGLVLFQPVTTGKTYLTQVLRQRVAYLMSNHLTPETTEDMRKGLSAGHTVEVAGYTLGQHLAENIDAKKMSEMRPFGKPSIYWLENGVSPDQGILPGSQKVVNALKEQGLVVNVASFGGSPIWQLNEREAHHEALSAIRELDLA